MDFCVFGILIQPAPTSHWKTVIPMVDPTGGPNLPRDSFLFVFLDDFLYFTNITKKQNILYLVKHYKMVRRHVSLSLRSSSLVMRVVRRCNESGYCRHISTYLCRFVVRGWIYLWQAMSTAPGKGHGVVRDWVGVAELPPRSP